MTGPLAHRTVLLTGASRGIGAATAKMLAELGARLVRISRSPMPELAGAIDFQCDLADARSRGETLARIASDLGTPDAIVSNAGAFLLAPVEETSDDLLREQVAINLEAPFAIARTFLPLMRERGAGRHILLGSISDTRAFPGNAAYSASKFGVRGMHEVLLEEYRGTGVLCTLISPGPTDTTVWDPFDPDQREGFTHRVDMLRPHDVADAVAWVLTRRAGVAVESLRINPA